MSEYSIIPTRKFSKDVKYYKKTKKYNHIYDDILRVTKEIEKGNFLGSELYDLCLQNNNHTYKVRSANTDTKSGESNGYRIIYYVVKDDMEVYLLTIYSKKDSNNIPTKDEIRKMILKYCGEDM